MRAAAIPIGKPLVHPAVDLLLIGGGLSFLVFGLVAAGALPKAPGGGGWLLVVFGANLAHFAASTVRLYTKRGASRELPFATFALPLVTLAVLRDQPHSADVVAVERSSVFVVQDAAAFLRTEPVVALYIAVVQSGRLDSANRMVIAARSRLVARRRRNPGLVAMLDEIGAALYRTA